jgi:dihydroflavonol-4-reductase
MRVAITGAAGFLGTNLVRLLAGDGHEVVAIDRVPVAEPRTSGRVRWLAADVLDPQAMERALDDVEVVFHLVAVISLKQEDPVAWRVNTEGVRTVARAALRVGVRRMVNCGSLASFHYEKHGTVTEESPRATDPRLPVYHRSKYAGEVALAEVVGAGLDAVTCNPTGIFGPADHPTHLSRMNASLLDAARGRAPVAVAGAFDMVDVRDVAHGFVLAAEKGRTGHNYLLPGQHGRLDEVTALAARLAGRRGPLVSLPVGLLEAVQPFVDPIAQRFGSDQFAAAALENLTMSPRVDGSKAAAELGYVPRPTEQTVRDLVGFFRDNGLVRSAR